MHSVFSSLFFESNFVSTTLSSTFILFDNIYDIGNFESPSSVVEFELGFWSPATGRHRNKTKNIKSEFCIYYVTISLRTVTLWITANCIDFVASLMQKCFYLFSERNYQVSILTWLVLNSFFCLFQTELAHR